MSATISLTSAKTYGVERVCTIWDQPRSSFYVWRRNHNTTGAEPALLAAPTRKRGPKTELSDTELLGKIQADLARSPFQGEGHRKVWARLRVLDEVRVSRKRILRIMRENQLLSPYRCRKATGGKHTGTIVTEAPNVMWGTDGTKILTVDDGYVWLFSAVEHWSAECVGWHLVKHGLAMRRWSRSRWDFTTSMAVSRPASRVVFRCVWRSRYPVSVGPLLETGSLLGHPA